MPKVQVTLPKNDTYNGEVVAVDTDDIALGDNFVPANVVRRDYALKTKVQEDIENRLAGQAANLKGQLLEDPDFAKTILAKHGVALRDGKIEYGEDIQGEAFDKALQDRLAAERQTWAESDVLPLKDALSSNESLIKNLQTQILHSEILEAARKAGVRQDLFSTLPGAPRAAIPVIAQTAHMFDVDENGNWSQRDLEGEGFIPNPTQGSPRVNAGPDQYFESLKTVETAAGWFPNERAGGPDVSGAKTAGSESKDGQRGTSQEDRIAELRKSQTTLYN